MTSCACLVGSGLKFIFHWNTQVLVLVESLFNSLADLAIFSTTENSDASSANNFGLHAKSSEKLFIYIRKSNDLSIEHYRTRASIPAHEEYCPFRTTLCFC